jgi:hypothetical protein
VDLVLLRAATSLCRYCPHREQFNQATLAAAYEKRTEKIKPDRAEYDAAKVRVCGGDGWHAGSVGVGDGRFGGCLASTCTLLFLLSHFSQMLPQPGLAHAQLPTHPSLQAADPEFYRTADSLLYGAAGRVSEAGIDRMVDELNERQGKSKAFSRRRKFREDRDVDYINDRNAHFNKKIERAFGAATAEIKANLERGTALP